jgi:hypothetical protein
VYIFERCKHCPAGDFCGKHGCVAWNNEAREKYDRWKQAADKFDAAEDDYMDFSGYTRGGVRRGGGHVSAEAVMTWACRAAWGLIFLAAFKFGWGLAFYAMERAGGG